VRSAQAGCYIYTGNLGPHGEIAQVNMAQVHFTSWLRELVPNGPVQAPGVTVGAALMGVFEREPQVRSYVLDDRGGLRKHVCVFADGMRLPNGSALSHPIRPEATLYVMQALSGG
jgi:molybdopterin synthase sulfur carrier subunit